MNFNIKKGNCEVTINMDCENEVENSIHPDNLKKVDPTNPDNPFDEVAKLHDYAMKRIFLIPNLRSFNEDEVLDQLSEIFEKYPVQSKFLKDIKKYNVREAMENISDNLSESFSYSFLYPPTPDQMESIHPFLHELILWMSSTVGNFDKTKDSLVDYLKDFIAYEKHIMNSKLEKETKDAALISMAIMRHSSIMYLEHFNSGTGTEPGVMGKKCQCKKVAKVAIADAIGALSGMGGGAVGVVVGAVIGSGKQLIKELD